MDNRLKLGDLVKTMHAYPTYGFALQMAAADRFMASLSGGFKGAVVRALTRLTR